MRKTSLLLLATVICCHFSLAQSVNKIVKIDEVSRIEKTLSADDMQGRRPGTPGGDKAAEFIAEEFRKAGLQSQEGTYLQEFPVVTAKQTSASGAINGQELDSKNFIILTQQSQLNVDQNSGYKIAKIAATDSFRSAVLTLFNSTSNTIVLLDSSFASSFGRLQRFKQAPSFGNNRNLIFVLTNQDPKTFSFSATHEIGSQKFKNVVGIIPGKSKKDEYVIFSGHYDHLGIGKAGESSDSIYNGANDDASGTTAVIMLAKYFAKKANNERTLVFVAFTAEESGGFGSQYFSRQYDPSKVMGMFNIEMIGTESKWGTNSVYMTGFEKTDMGKIMEKNLDGSPFKIYPDPYPAQQLFYRSDNATLARQGVPAHSISTSKMDAEPHYHKVSDEFATLDMKNMTEIIKAIALSATSIIEGKDTPTRVDATQLR